MRKLNLSKVKWINREMRKGELSVWQIAEQQNITPQYARRVYRRFAEAK